MFSRETNHQYWASLRSLPVPYAAGCTFHDCIYTCIHARTALQSYTYTCTKHSRVLINTRSHCTIRAPGPMLSLKPLTLPSLPHCNSHSLYLSSRSRACSHTPSFPLFTSGCTCTRGADLQPSACTPRAGTHLRSMLQSQPRHAHPVLLLHPALAWPAGTWMHNLVLADNALQCTEAFFITDCLFRII